MPFTLAHPAAILPLRHIRYLRTAPLVIGAMVPDLPYYLPGGLRLRSQTHTFESSLTICLLLGYAALIAVFVLRKPLTALLPARARWLCLHALAPFRHRPVEWLIAPIAIVLGDWTHLLWDSFTHTDGWMVRRMAALSAPVTIGPYTGTVCHVLQYLSSVVGLIVLAVWYQRLPAPPPGPARQSEPRPAPAMALLLVVTAAVLIGAVQGIEYFGRTANVYLTLELFLTHGLAWGAALYLVAGSIVALGRSSSASEP